MSWIKNIWNKIKNLFCRKQVAYGSTHFIRPDATIINIDDKTDVLDVDLVDDNISEKDRKKVKQYTKKWVDIILTVSLIDVQFCFVLAFLGKDQIAETLGIAIITEIVAIGLGYMLKAFFETNAQKKNEIEMERIKRTYEVTKPIVESDEESVG